jgi:hypothetical protein
MLHRDRPLCLSNSVQLTGHVRAMGLLVSAACGHNQDSGGADTALFSRTPFECLGPGPRRGVWSAVGLLLGQPQPAAGLALDLRPLLAVAPQPLVLLL